MRSNKNASDNF